MRPTPCLFNSLFLTAGVMLAAPTLHAEEVVENSSPAVTELDTSFVTATARRPISGTPLPVSV